MTEHEIPPDPDLDPVPEEITGSGRSDAAVQALVGRAVEIANDIIQGRTHPYSGAKKFWRMEAELAGPVEDLLAFVGLASEWEDVPDKRPEYERDIVAAADRFRAKWGP